MHILLADDDQTIRNFLREFLTDLGHSFKTAVDGNEAVNLLDEEEFDLVLLDLVMPHRNGIEVLKHAKERNQESEVIIITGHGSVKTAIEALGQGAYAYVRKPIDLRDLKHSIDRISELLELRNAYKVLSEEKSREYDLDQFICKDEVMIGVKDQIREILGDKEPVIITGPSGIGKSHIANLIHFNESAPEAPVFLLTPEEIDCMVEAESYLTAEDIELKISNLYLKLSQNNYKSLIIKRVSELPNKSQAELAKAVFKTHVAHDSRLRVIALMRSAGGRGNYNQILEPSLAAGFKHHIHLPPLRSRRDDIIPLAQMFLNRNVMRNHDRAMQFSRPVQEFFQIYNWPNNVSELKHLVNYIVSTNRSRLIKISDLRRIHREISLDHPEELRSLENILTLAEKQTISRIFKSKDV